jgi:hypothetical protein
MRESAIAATSAPPATASDVVAAQLAEEIVAAHDDSISSLNGKDVCSISTSDATPSAQGDSVVGVLSCLVLP